MTAARFYGPRVVGVVLTGTLDDGAAGLARIKRRGGIALVQDPATAAHPGMPERALREVDVDRCVPLADVGRRDPGSRERAGSRESTWGPA